jgi:hypothetical protein
MKEKDTSMEEKGGETRAKGHGIDENGSFSSTIDSFTRNKGTSLEENDDFSPERQVFHVRIDQDASIDCRPRAAEAVSLLTNVDFVSVPAELLDVQALRSACSWRGFRHDARRRSVPRQCKREERPEKPPT